MTKWGKKNWEISHFIDGQSNQPEHLEFFGGYFCNYRQQKTQQFIGFTGLIELILAERVGFEPTVPLTVRLISSQVHSTTLPPLRTELQL